MRAQGSQLHPEMCAALEQILSAGGKRVRPAITLLTGGMLGGEEERMISLAAAIELLHTATLVHDDLIDGAIIRRGIDTLNAKWSPATTVLSGDFIFARAAKLASDTGSIAVMRLFAETLATVVNGEITQMFSKNGIVNLENYYKRIYAKTASMFELATTAAALLCGIDNQIVNRMREYGYSIGMAFQIVDDILDFTANEDVLGKPVASDLRNGVFTLPVITYSDLHPEDQDLKAIQKAIHPPDHMVDKLVASIRKSNSIQLSMDYARRFIERGLESLKDLPVNIERKALEDLAVYIVDRPL